MNFKWKKLTPAQLRYYIFVCLPSLYISRRVPVLTLRAVWREYNLNGYDAGMQEAKARGVLTVDEQTEALALFERVLIEEGKCRKCGSTQNLTIDHLIPKSKRPDLYAVRSNLTAACLKCNMTRGKRDAEGFYD